MLPTRAILVLLLTACGPSTGASTGSDTSTDSGASTGTDASTSTGAPTTTGAPITTSTDATTGTAETSTGEPTTGAIDPTTSSATTSSDASTGSDSDTTTGAADVAYAAFFWAGGLDHVMIHKADFTNDRCTTLHLAWPGQPQPDLAITVPDEFAAQNAAIAIGTEGCLEGMPMGEAVAASAGAGAVDWQKGREMFCPLMLDVDVVLDFPQDLPWVPAQEQLQTSAIPVQNCP